MAAMRKMIRESSPGVLAAALVAGVIVGAYVLSGGGGSQENGAAPSHSALATPGLDDIPGLGRSADAAARDDRIALWESWSRAKNVESCMNRAGFVWHAELDYPAEMIPEIASSMGVRAESTSTNLDPAAANRLYVESLDEAELEGYHQALYGESTEDIVAAEESGGAPGDRDDFRQRGCKGESQGAVGSIWELKRELASELRTLREDARRTPEFAAAATKYAECARDHGADVDNPMELEESGVSLDVLGLVALECDDEWRAANEAGIAAAADDFKNEHAARIDSQMRKYGNLDDDLQRDSEFRAFLATTVSAS